MWLRRSEARAFFSLADRMEKAYGFSMSYVEQIIGRFGGVRPMATAMNIHPATVQSWKTRGQIPAHRQQSILERSQSLGLGLRPADFFPASSEKYPEADRDAAA